MNRLWDCDILASSSNLISASLSLSNSPEMFPSDSLGSYRMKGAALGVMWPLTSDLGVCKLIMPDRLSIGGGALCFEEETSGWREGLSPRPAHTAEHTRAQPGNN